MSLHCVSCYYNSHTLSFILRMHVEVMVFLFLTPVLVTLIFYEGVRHNTLHLQV